MVVPSNAEAFVAEAEAREFPFNQKMLSFAVFELLNFFGKVFRLHLVDFISFLTLQLYLDFQMHLTLSIFESDHGNPLRQFTFNHSFSLELNDI